MTLANMRQGTRTDLEHRAKLPQVSLDDAARKVGVGRRSVVTAKKVQKDGDPALVEAVKRGDISVAGAERIAAKTRDEQREIVAGGKQAIKQAAKSARKAQSIRPRPRTTVADVRKAWIDAAETRDKLSDFVSTLPAHEATKWRAIFAGYSTNSSYRRPIFLVIRWEARPHRSSCANSLNASRA